MPVTLGKNLVIKDNVINAKYTELFKKLNKAYAWTHTETTEYGTAGFINPGTTDIFNIVECRDYTKAYIENGGDSGRVDMVSYVIDGKLYAGSPIAQIGSATNWKEASGGYGLDENGGLWKISGNTVTQCHSDVLWTKLSKTSYSGIYAIDKDGYLYKITNNTTKTKIGTMSGWTDVTNEYSGMAGICNGYLYKLDNTSATILDNTRNTYIKVMNDDANIAALTSNGEVFIHSNYTTPLITNVKGMFRGYASSGLHMYYITNNGNLYMSTGTGNLKLLNDTMSWSSVIGNQNTYIYGVADGKLYYVTNLTSTPNFTQIGTETTFQTVDGNASLIMVTLNRGITVSHTVYTTKSPLVGDNTYSDEDLTVYSTITNVSSVSITDKYGPYNRDGIKDKSFTGIPGETIHETVSVIDILNATQGE